MEVVSDNQTRQTVIILLNGDYLSQNACRIMQAIKQKAYEYLIW